MENEIGPLGQPAHNNPKQQLSYFDSLNHIESRHLDEPEQNWEEVKKSIDAEEKEKEAIDNYPSEKG